MQKDAKTVAVCPTRQWHRYLSGLAGSKDSEFDVDGTECIMEERELRESSSLKRCTCKEPAF
jgi:hypothetical protein